MASWTSVSIAIDNTTRARVEPAPRHDFVHVYLNPDSLVAVWDPAVAEELARVFWDAADHLRAKAGITAIDPDVARTLAIATGDDAA